MTRVNTIGFESGVATKEIFAGSVQSSVVRSGGYAALEGIVININTSPQTIYMGFAFRMSGENSTWFLLEDTNSATHVEVTITPDMRVHLYGPAGTLVASSANPCMMVNAWQYAELYYYCADSSGRFTLKVDGVTVIDYTGDTKYGANNFAIFTGWSGGTWSDYYWDDIVINDTNGSYNNSWPGVVRLIPIRPNAAGDNTGLTPSAGNNYECVDEVPASSTDYVWDNVVDQYDLYNCGTYSLPVGSTIKNVIVQASATMDSGAGNVALMVKSGATTDTGDDQALGVSYKVYSEVYPVNPDDSAAWEQSDIDALQIGVKAR